MAARKKTKAHRKTGHHRAATTRGHHKPANSNEPSLSSRQRAAEEIRKDRNAHVNAPADMTLAQAE